MSKYEYRVGALAAALSLALIGSGYMARAAGVSSAAAPPSQTQTERSENAYGLGFKATPAEIAGWNIDVEPDGAGLPAGQGSVAQGEKIYNTDCESCHGTFGESNAFQTLQEVKDKLNYAPTLFDYINRAMPFPAPKSLSADQVYAVTAYVLNLLEIVPDNFVANKESLPSVKMPNRGKLVPFAGMMSVDGTPDVHNVACMKNCVAGAVKITGSLPAGFVDKMYGDIQDNFRGLAVMNEEGEPKWAEPAGSSTVGSSAESGPKLIEKFGCVACHSVDHKIVGPAFRQVSAKYRNDKDAVAYLTHKIRHGGSGVWGDAAMPAQTEPSDVDLNTIVKWILALPPEQ